MSARSGRDYPRIVEEIEAVTAGETDWIANLANVAAILHERLPFLWTGFYRVVEEELVLGPFQGQTACIRIGRGRGVCGAAWERDEVLVVPDVHRFEGHIACDARTRSEIVLPIHGADGAVWGVLDIDSEREGGFGEEDAVALVDVVAIVEKLLAAAVEPG